MYMFFSDRHNGQHIHEALGPISSKSKIGEGKRAREGAGSAAAHAWQAHPRICLSPHFSRSGIWTSAQRNPRFHAHRQSILLCAGESTSIGMSRIHHRDSSTANIATTISSLRNIANCAARRIFANICAFAVTFTNRKHGVQSTRGTQYHTITHR